MNIEIKKLSANDWQIFKELRLQMLKEEPQAFARTYDEVSKRTDEEWKENTENEEAGILAVWLDGKLAGMNGYYYPERSIVEIWGMFIRKEFRGMGLGKKLMGEIEKEIRKDGGVKKIQVSVTSSQTAAFELYKKLGFREIKRMPNKTRLNGQSYEEILLEKLIPQP